MKRAFSFVIGFAAAEAAWAGETAVSAFSAQSLLGVLLVLGLIGACAWLARRHPALQGKGSGPVKLVGGAMVGARERVVVVEVDDTWIVLGVAPGRVNALHALPRAHTAATQTPPSANQPKMPAFAAQLRKLLGARHA